MAPSIRLGPGCFPARQFPQQPRRRHHRPRIQRNLVINLAPVDRHGARGRDPQPHLIAPHLGDDDLIGLAGAFVVENEVSSVS